MAVADQITGSVLNVACGAGDHSLDFACRGCLATSIDFLEEAITRAKKKAEGRNLPVTYLVKDALDLKGWPERFDNGIESGLFHVFSDKDRRRHVEGPATVLMPDGSLLLICFSDLQPGSQEPRHVTKQELHCAFTHGWVFEALSRLGSRLSLTCKTCNSVTAGRRHRSPSYGEPVEAAGTGGP